MTSSSWVKVGGVGCLPCFACIIGSSFQVFEVPQTGVRPKTGALVPGVRVVDHDGVGFLVVIRLAVVFQRPVMGRVRQNLRNQLREAVPVLDLRKQFFVDDVLLVGVARGHGAGDFQLCRGRLFGLLVLFWVVVGSRGGGNAQNGRQRHGGRNRSRSHRFRLLRVRSE